MNKSILLCLMYCMASVYCIAQTTVNQDLLPDLEAFTTAPIELQTQTNVVSYLDFDASNDNFAQVNALQDDLNGTSRSAFMWIRTDTQVGGTPVFLFAINTDTGENRALFGIENNTIILSGSGTDSATTMVTDGEWHHVGYTYDGTTFETKLYVDGVVENTITQDRTTVSSDLYSLGQEFDTGLLMGNFYNGLMAEVSIWSTVLDITAIDLIRQSRIETTHPAYANLEGYYGYANIGDSATLLRDYSAVGNNGTISDTAITETNIFEMITGFNSTGWYSPSWQENGTTFATAATTSVTPALGMTAYSLQLARDFINITDNFIITGIEITYSGPGFTENAANDGVVNGSIDINLIGDTFASNTLTIGTDVTVGNIPEGLTPAITTTTTLTDWTAQTAAEQNDWQSITYGNGLFVAVSDDGTNRVMTSPDGVTWTPRMAAEQNEWDSVTYGNGQFVAISNNGTNRVMTSPDGITWTPRMAAEQNNWSSVTYGNGLFVAVSDTGTNRVMTSPDGITWTARMASEDNSWRSVAYGNGQFVAVSTGGTNRVMTSPDGITWTAQVAPQQNFWLSVTYGNGLFVAVSATGSNRTMTSPDGLTWTSRTAAELNQWISVTYGNGLFVAVSQNGTNRVMTSLNGISWTAQMATEDNPWRSVTHGNGQFVAVSNDGANRVMTASTQGLARLNLSGNATNHQDSDDVSDITFEFADSAFTGGNAATFISTTGPASSSLGVDFFQPEITYNGLGFTENAANDGAVSGSIDINLIGDTFTSNPLTIGTDVTIGNIPEGLTPAITTSTTLTDWTAQMASETIGWRSVTYGDGQFVAVSENGTNQVMTSPDGVTWTAQTPAQENEWQSVTYGNGRFVAVSQNGTNQVMTSLDGETWTSRTAAEQNGWQSVTYGNGLFVAVARNGSNRVMTSPNGITWTRQMAAQQNNWSSVTYGNGLFVAVSTNGASRVMTSPDGETWTSRFLPEQSLWTSVTYGNGQFVAVPFGSNRVITSLDGITWTARTATQQNNWQSVTYGSGQFVAVSSTGTNRVMSSPDGISWTAQMAAEQNFWRGVTYGNGRFVAVTQVGTKRVMTASLEGLATLSLNGNATNHQDSDDVNDITFEFADSAFTESNAATVINATGPASSNLEVDFLDNLPSAITQDLLPDLEAFTTAPIGLQAQTNVVSYLDFDASNNDFAEVNALQDDLNGRSRSAFMWIRTDTQVGGTPVFLFAINTDTGGNRALFGIENNTIILSGDGTDFATTTVTDGEWHHVGYTYNGFSFETKLYVDGVVENTITQDRTAAPSDLYSLGQEFDGGLSMGNFYNGLMAEVSIWSTVLDQTAIDLIRQSRIEPTHPAYANLEGYYGYANIGDSATLLRDYSAAGNNGSISDVAITETNMFEMITGFNSAGWYSPSWQENGITFATTATPSVTPLLGMTAYSLQLDRDFVSITDNFIITGIDPEITYSGPGFTENAANDGAVSGSIDINLVGDTFASNLLTIGTDVTVGNIPEGLTPSITTTTTLTDWTAQTATEQSSWQSVTYGNGQFVAVSSNGTNRVMTSPDGVTWTAQTPPFSKNWLSVTYGNGRFVAVAQFSPNQVMTSPDGITWTAQMAAEDNPWNSVTYGNGQFVAISGNGTNRVMTSPDGITWTPRMAVEDNQWRSITHGNGLFVAVSDTGTNRAMTSPDGITWTARMASEDNSWRSVAYGNGQFVAVSTGGTNRVMTSPDGITWTAQTAAEENQWFSVTYGNGLFVAVSFDGTNRVMTSPDGITWTSLMAAEDNPWRSVTHGNGQFVAVSNNGSNRVMTASVQTLATLSLSGNATNHQDSDDVSDITFEFADSAFTGRNAATVINATGPASSNLGVDFLLDPPCAGIITTWDGTSWDNGAPTQNDTAIINANYNTATSGNIMACELTVNAGVVLNVSDNTFINITNDITVDGDLTVANAGSIVQVADDAITINSGTITVNKTTPNLEARDFIVLSSPMTAETNGGVLGGSNRVFSIIPENFIPNTDPLLNGVVGNFIDDDGDYIDNLERDNLNLTGDATGLDNILNPGQGYIVFPQAPSATGATIFDHTHTEGTFNNGDIVAPIHYNGPATANNFNLLGNPYPSAIDTDMLIANNAAINEVYFWEHITMPNETLPGFNTQNFSMDDVSIRNVMMGVAAQNGGTVPGQYMASGQGFGILANQAAAGTDVTFTNTMRVTGNNNTPRSSEQDNRLWLRLDSETYTSQSITGIGFVPEATPAIDPGYDSNRLATTISLFSTSEEGEQLSIQGREVFDPTMQINLGFQTLIPESKNYTISIDQLEGAALTQSDIILIDNLTGITTNLQETSYRFTANETLQEGRFTLVFQEREVLSTQENSLDQTIKIYPNPTKGVLTITSTNTALSDIAVYDLTGRMIYTASLNSEPTTVLDLNHLAAGNYIIQLTTTQDDLVTKRFIKQ